MLRIVHVLKNVNFSSLFPLLAALPLLLACPPRFQEEMPAPPYYQAHEELPLGKILPPPKETVLRGAIDIGSGATKLRIAKVDPRQQKIEAILVNESFAVPYQEQLEKSSDHTFDEKVMQQGIEGLKKSQEIAKKYHVEKVVAVATAAFRNARNADAFIQRIEKETGIQVFVIDQDLEGKLAFEAALNQTEIPPSQLIVWDIGGGSIQLTTQNEEGQYLIYRGHVASVPFKNMIIKEIQKKNSDLVATPNPMTSNEIQLATQKAREVAEKVDLLFKEKIREPTTRVVGVGSVFAYGIDPLMEHRPFTAQQLERGVRSLAGKTDQDMGGGDFANVAVSNAILTLGFMQTLSMPQLQIIDVNNADGAFLYAPFWESP